MSVRSTLRPALRLLCTGAGVATAGTAIAALTAGTASAAGVGDEAVSVASHQAGDPYVYGAAGPGSFDCSGLVQYVYGQLGISLPHSTSAQYASMRHIPQAQAQPGDVLFVYDASGHIDHDGIYAGGGYWWVARHTGTVVEKQRMYTDSYLVGRPYGSSGSGGSSGSDGSSYSGGAVQTSYQPSSAGSTGSSSSSSTGTLYEGSRGAGVEAVQRALGISADGVFGPLTDRSVRGFQGQHGLSVDGVVGPQTHAALFGGSAGGGSGPSVESTGSLSSVLHEGSRGPAVEKLQNALGVSADGVFGPITQHAVTAFQRSHGLSVDGVVGPQTWRALGGSFSA